MNSNAIVSAELADLKVIVECSGQKLAFKYRVVLDNYVKKLVDDLFKICRYQNLLGNLIH